MIAEAWALPPALLIPLVAAHLLGDFVLQPGWMADGKHRLRVVALHAVVVAGTSWLLLGHFGTWWWLIPALAVTHLAVDLAKGVGDRWVEAVGSVRDDDAPGAATPGRRAPNGRIVLFLLDQTAHLLVLAGIVWAVNSSAALHGTLSGRGLWLDLFGPGYLTALVLVSGWVVAAPATGSFLYLFLDRFEAELSPEQRAGGLPRGGYWIGLAERTLIYVFLLIGEPAGIGFLAAAKSVFRLGEVKEASQRSLAEYILIGTLLSFGLAMVIGLVARAVLSLLAGP
ncbi:MAG: DUF3307 domain-containing protein [Gemmatimonadota bacterium]